MRPVAANANMNKVPFMIQATEARKSRPSINILNQFPTKRRNPNETQVHKGLDNVVTKKFPDMDTIHRPEDLCGTDIMRLFGNSNTNKVIFIMGATGSGKSRLSIDLATYFPAEIINSDKIQVYKGLDIVGNKVSNLEREGLPHHLLGVIERDIDFNAHDFCREALSAIEEIQSYGKVPIIVGGSNSFLEALVEDPMLKFKSSYKCYFFWMDVSLPILYSRVSERVNQMVDAGLILWLYSKGNSILDVFTTPPSIKEMCRTLRGGLVDEVRGIFDVKSDYSKGIRRAIGVAEMHDYFVAEAKLDNRSREILLASAIDKIKINTCKLVCRQVGKIKRLRDELRWPIHRIDATAVFKKSGEEANDVWNEVVLQPCLETLDEFLRKDEK